MKNYKYTILDSYDDIDSDDDIDIIDIKDDNDNIIQPQPQPQHKTSKLATGAALVGAGIGGAVIGFPAVVSTNIRNKFTGTKFKEKSIVNDIMDCIGRVATISFSGGFFGILISVATADISLLGGCAIAAGITYSACGIVGGINLVNQRFKKTRYDITEVGIGNLTKLHMSVHERNLDEVNLLLKNPQISQIINIQTDNGETALDMAYKLFDRVGRAGRVGREKYNSIISLLLRKDAVAAIYDIPENLREDPEFKDLANELCGQFEETMSPRNIPYNIPSDIVKIVECYALDEISEIGRGR